MKTVISMSADREFVKESLVTFCATFGFAAKVKAGETYDFVATIGTKAGRSMLLSMKALKYTIGEEDDGVVTFSNLRISGSITFDGAEATIVASFV